MASSFLESLRTYAGQWSVKSSAKLSADEAAQIRSITVQASDFGLSACLLMYGGGRKYVPVSRDSALAEGDVVNKNSVQVITLEKEGEADIIRLDGTAL